MVVIYIRPLNSIHLQYCPLVIFFVRLYEQQISLHEEFVVRKKVTWVSKNLHVSKLPSALNILLVKDIS